MSFEDCVTKFRCTISKQMEDEEKEKKETYKHNTNLLIKYASKEMEKLFETYLQFNISTWIGNYWSIQALNPYALQFIIETKPFCEAILCSMQEDKVFLKKEGRLSDYDPNQIENLFPIISTEAFLKTLLKSLVGTSNRCYTGDPFIEHENFHFVLYLKD